MNARLASISLALFVAAPFAGAQLSPVIYVDENATGPVHDGSSWCNAYTTLYEALGVAASGQSIHVAGGLYTPDPSMVLDPRDASFHLVDGVSIVAAFAGCGAPNPDARDFANDTSYIRGDPLRNDYTWGDQSDNSYHVLIADNLSTGLVLDGLYVDAGNATNPAVTDGNIGGGLLARGTSQMKLIDCIFQDDKASTGPDSLVGRGGAVYLRKSSVNFIGTLFRESIGGEAAGGVYLESSAANFIDCTFAGCISSLRGGGVFNDRQSSITLRDSEFIACSSHAWPEMGRGGDLYNAGKCLAIRTKFTGGAGVDGGAVYNGKSSFSAANCSFTWATAQRNGGGMFNYGSSVTLSNCLFAGCSAESGGGVYSEASKLAVGNCTLTQQTATVGAAGIELVGNGGGASVRNSILWANSTMGVSGEAEQISVAGTTVLYLDFSDVQGLTGALGGTGNIGLDPLFAAPGLFDFRPTLGSPCIDAGSNSLLLLDFADLDGDLVFIEPTPLDLDDTTRVVNGTVDMGAYE